MAAIKSSDVIIQQRLKNFKGRSVNVDVGINEGILSMTIQDVSNSDNRFGTVHTDSRFKMIMTYLYKEAKVENVHCL